MRNNSWAAVHGLSTAALLLLGGYSLPAADLPSQGSKVDVIVLIYSPQNQGEAFRQLLADAAKYKLQKLGLEAEIVAASKDEQEKPAPKAEQSGAAAALVCSYGVEGQQMNVTMGWYDARSDSSAATVQTSGRVDLNLDEVILAAFDQILDKVGDRIREIESRHKPDASQPAAETPKPGVALATPSAARGVSSQARRVLLCGGFAPFLPTGAAAYYFTLGYLPSVLASIFVDTPMGPLGFGLYAGMDYFTATGTEDFSNTFLVPMGLDVRYELGASNLRPFFHVAAGPAVLVMATGTQGTITSVLPFVKSGIGLQVMVTPNAGISAQADYDLYFEMPYLLMGFSPSLSMELRL